MCVLYIVMILMPELTQSFSKARQILCLRWMESMKSIEGVKWVRVRDSHESKIHEVGNAVHNPNAQQKNRYWLQKAKGATTKNKWSTNWKHFVSGFLISRILFIFDFSIERKSETSYRNAPFHQPDKMQIFTISIAFKFKIPNNQTMLARSYSIQSASALLMESHE